MSELETQRKELMSAALVLASAKKAKGPAAEFVVEMAELDLIEAARAFVKAEAL